MTKRWAVATAALTALVLTAAPVTAKSARPKPMTCTGTGRERVCTVALPPGVRVRHNKVRVLLPAGYQQRSGARYPVVFMLHGVGDDETAWTNPGRGNLAVLTASCRAIFVMPDGGSGKEAGWYSDWVDRRFQYETFHTQVLPNALDATFRTQGARGRAVAGMSMGGFGALSYAARHPGMYRAAATFSAFADTRFGAPLSGVGYELTGQNDVYSTGAPSKGVWGDQTANADVWAAHNPYDLAAKLRRLPVYLAGGTGTPGGTHDDPSKLPNYATEAFLRVQIDRLAAQLRGAPGFVDARYTGGYHDWVYWRDALVDSFRTLMPALRASVRGCGAPVVRPA